MADNVAITAGSGTSIKTDQIGSDHYQIVKLADGTTDASGVIAADIGVKANALRVAPASDITDATYIGDIKFGEALPAGTAAIGKLAANTGVDIGDVDVTSLPALAAGTNLVGKVGIDQTTPGTTNRVDIGAALPAGANAIGKLAANSGVDIGDVDVATHPTDTFAADAQAYGKGVLMQGDDGTDRRAILVGTDGHVQVDVVAAPSTAVTSAGTFAVQATAVGTIADDATTPGAPVMIGGSAKETDGTDPGSVSAEDDVVRLITDRNRRLLVDIAHPNSWKAYHDETAAQTDHALVATPGAGLSLYITDIIVSNGATAGTVKFEEDTATAKTQMHGTLYFAINGGCVINFKTPLRITANKDFGFTSATVTTHSITVLGYTAP